MIYKKYKHTLKIELKIIQQNIIISTKCFEMLCTYKSKLKHLSRIIHGQRICYGAKVIRLPKIVSSVGKQS